MADADITGLLTIEETAAKIGRTARQVRWWIETGELLFVPVGRRIYIDMADYEAMVKRLKTRKARKTKDANGNEEGEEIELNE